MKPSKIQTALSLTGSLFLSVGVFNKPLGLSETWEWVAPILAIACFIPLIALQRRRRNARLAAELVGAGKPFPNRKFWLLVLAIVAASLSGPLWLPYTGSTLPTSTLIITSLSSCALAILVFVLSWRYWSNMPNQSSRSDE